MEWIGPGLQAHQTDLKPLMPFRPRLPWVGADLQTIRNTVRRGPDPLPPDMRLLVDVGSAGALNIAVNHPEPGSGTGGRSVLLVHGLGGDETGTYMVTAARFFLRRGYQVFRMNMRGAGASRKTSAPPYHAGLTSDLRFVIAHISNRLQGGMAILGFSLGGHQVLKMASESEVPPSVAALLSVSAPLDLAAASARLEALRNRPYRGYLTRVLKAQLQDVNLNMGSLSVEAMESVRQIDDQVIAPVFGFGSADDYYDQAAVWSDIGRIRVPTLAVHAVNDPWIPAQAYRSARWPGSVPAGAVLTNDGGHVGFHGHGQTWPWYLSVFDRFLDTIMI